MRISLLSSSLIVGAFALLLVTGCKETPVATADNNPAPKPTTQPGTQCPSKQDVMASTRKVTSADGEHTVYIVPDSQNTALRRVVTEGVTARYSFERVGPIVFRPDAERFALIGRTNGADYVLEFEKGNGTAVHAEGVTGTRDDWVCYSATGRYLFTLAGAKNKWTLLSLELDSNERFARYPLVGEASELSALKILPAHQKGWEGISYVVDSKTQRLEVQTWIK